MRKPGLKFNFSAGGVSGLWRHSSAQCLGSGGFLSWQLETRGLFEVPDLALNFSVFAVISLLCCAVQTEM